MNVEHVYEAISLLRLEVRNFKSRRGGKGWNWECQVCGDGSTGRKSRFGVDIKGQGAVCNCFNCGYAAPFSHYLRSYHPSVFERFAIDNIKETATKLFDHNDLFLQNIDDSDLLTIFYGDTPGGPNEWINEMKRHKINITKQNFERLYAIYRERQ